MAYLKKNRHRPDGPGDVAYRGYLIRTNVTKQMWIEKDGYLIQWVADSEEATRVIDAMLGD